MIRITSKEQALGLRGTIPELAVTRSLQFQGDGYDHERDGHIVVLERESDLSCVQELGTTCLFDADGIPTYEYIEVFAEDDDLVFEMVWQIDDERTVAVVIRDGPWLGLGFRRELHEAVDGQPLTVP